MFTQNITQSDPRTMVSKLHGCDRGAEDLCCFFQRELLAANQLERLSMRIGQALSRFIEHSSEVVSDGHLLGRGAMALHGFDGYRRLPCSPALRATTMLDDEVAGDRVDPRDDAAAAFEAPSCARDVKKGFLVKVLRDSRFSHCACEIPLQSRRELTPHCFECSVVAF